MTHSDPRAAGASSLRIYLRLLGYVKPYIGYFALSILGFVIFASGQPLLAGILKYFVDGLADPEAAMFPGVPLLQELRLLEIVPLMLVVIAAVEGSGAVLGHH